MGLGASAITAGILDDAADLIIRKEWTLALPRRRAAEGGSKVDKVKRRIPPWLREYVCRRSAWVAEKARLSAQHRMTMGGGTTRKHGSKSHDDV
jgi:hypothetical protein